jgi:hypothetical protein
MPNTPWKSVINSVINGTDVSGEVLNPILASYTARTQYLYEKFLELDNKSVLIAFDQPVTDTFVKKYSIVFFDAEQNGLKLAKAAVAESFRGTLFKAANSSYAIGIVKDDVPSGPVKKVGVWLQGLITTAEAAGYELLTQMLDDNDANQNVTSGPLFLSNTQPGKLTFEPGGMAIFIGYAKNKNEIFLNPTFDAVNDIFYTFRFSLLDRPAGVPVLSGSSWAVGSVDLSRVGWVPADSVLAKKPTSPTEAVGSLFYYNIPDDASIDADDGLSVHEKKVAKNLRNNFPPNPTTFSMLTVNGVIQQLREEGETDGIYFINESGIWWYDASNGKQPWSTDLVTSLRFKANASSKTITLVNASGSANLVCPFKIGTPIKFFTNDPVGSPLPPTLDSITTYYVKTLNVDTFQFQVTTNPNTVAGSIVDITLDPLAAGRTVYVQWSPSAWKVGKGNISLRPRMSLLYVKLNPDYRLATVTSLRPFNKLGINDSSKSIGFFDVESDDIPSKVGDLLLRYNLPVADPIAESPVTEQAIKNIVYDEPSGELLVYTSPVVTSISGSGGIKVVKNTSGAHVISSSPSSIPTLVTGVEPENSRLEFIGLNSFLTFDYDRLPCGFVGKILLPDTVLNFPLAIKLIALGKDPIVGSRTKVNLRFEYSVMAPSALLTTTTLVNTYTHVFPNNYIQNTNLTIAPPAFTIPADKLITNGIVNFRIQRPRTVASDDYKGFAVIAAYWSIG